MFGYFQRTENQHAYIDSMVYLVNYHPNLQVNELKFITNSWQCVQCILNTCQTSEVLFSIQLERLFNIMFLLLYGNSLISFKK